MPLMRRRAIVVLAMTLAGSLAAGCQEPPPPFAVESVYSLSPWERDPVRAASAAEVIECLQTRLDHAGHPTYEVASCEDGVAVRLPAQDAAQLAELDALVTARGELVFRIVADDAVTRSEREKRRSAGVLYAFPKNMDWVPTTAHEIEGRRIERPDTLVIVPEKSTLQALREELEKEERDEARVAELRAELRRIREESVFGSEDFERTEVNRDQRAQWVVLFELRDRRRAAFRKFTEAHVKRQLAMIADGEVIGAPVIMDPLPGRGQVPGSGPFGWKKEEAERMASVWSAPPLPLKPTLESRRDL